MSDCKLTYFNVTSLGEPIRFLLSYANIDFVDFRFDHDEWPAVRPTTPYGHAPVFEIDGKKAHQSAAICRYLAKKCGLAGKDDWETLEIDSTVDTIYDLRTKIRDAHYESVASVRAAKKKAADELVPFYVQRLDQQVEENGGYLVGGRLSLADVVFVAFLDYLNNMTRYDVIEEAPNLRALKKKVLAEPAIKAWIAKRPKSPY